ncbi:unnamed protein product [Rhizophagus irregularis]|uniref:Uncharacterized protein n=1 Tax=Rhizophagus irregularis TaxID=588596 RepID=A0A915ZU53_9GLOM|nr:unnamed protein product [Rhizophagus irregularis]
MLISVQFYYCKFRKPKPFHFEGNPEWNFEIFRLSGYLLDGISKILYVSALTFHFGRYRFDLGLCLESVSFEMVSSSIIRQPVPLDLNVESR